MEKELKERYIIKGKFDALEDLEKRFSPIFLFNGATIGEDGFDLIMNEYYDMLTKELETIEGHGR